jgi:hypothetical protein
LIETAHVEPGMAAKMRKRRKEENRPQNGRSR